MTSWDMTGVSRQKMLLNKRMYRNLCTTLDGDKIIAARQMPFCSIAFNNYDQWYVRYGDEWKRYDTLDEVIRVIRETDYIILYDNTEAKFFKTKEEVEKYLSNQLDELKGQIKSQLEETKKLIHRKREIIEILNSVESEEK